MESLFLEDLAPKNYSMINEEYEFNEVDNMLLKADLELYETYDQIRQVQIEYAESLIDFYNEDTSKIVTRDTVYITQQAPQAINAGETLFILIMKTMTNILPKYKRSAEKVIEEYKQIPKANVRSVDVGILKLKQVFPDKDNDRTFVELSHDFVMSVFKELDYAVKNINNQKDRDKILKTFNEHMNFKLRIPNTIFAATLDRPRKYMDEFCQFIEKEIDLFKDRMNKLKSLNQTLKKSKKIDEKLLNFISAISRSIKNISSLISAYIHNANIICMKLKKNSR